VGNSRADVWSLTLSFPRDQRQQWVADLFNDAVNSDFECLAMEMTFTNKLGVVFLLLGCCFLLALDWLGTIVIILGLVFIILGFFLSIYNRPKKRIDDDSTGLGGRLYDDD